MDEAIRNVGSVGGELQHLALLDNFAWGDVHDPHILGAAIECARGAADAARAYRTPFISGKDSLHNVYRTEDKKFDVLVMPANPPSPSIQQIALQNKIRLLSVDISKQGKLLRTPGRTKRVIAADAYGANQVNDAPIPTLGALVGLSVRADMPAEKMYVITKAFWEHIDEVHAAAPWMKKVINLDSALEVVPGKLHSAGPISSGRSQYSPCPPMASTILS